MQKERLVKFDFDFNKVYKELRKTTNKIARNKSNKIEATRYYYLSKEDFVQDVFDITLKYLKENHNITEDHFLSLFWSNWKMMRLRSFDKRDPRVREYKNFVQESTLLPETNSKDFRSYQESLKTTQPDLDLKLLVDNVGETFPTIQKYLSGYSFAEGGREVGISTRGYSKRFHKEVEQLKRIAHVQ